MRNGTFANKLPVNMIEIKDLGLVPYREAWELQERLFTRAIEAKLAGKTVPGTVLLVEHPHVYTLGRSGMEENMLLNTLELKNIQAEFIKVNRGGDITYHGPGQLVVYPILDLNFYALGIRNYIHLLEELVIRVLNKYGIQGERVEGATGVWLDAGTPAARKISAIGVKCSREITMHGLSLNVNPDLDYFGHIHPCGFTDKGVTSLQKELKREISLPEIKAYLRTELSNLMRPEEK